MGRVRVGELGFELELEFSDSDVPSDYTVISHSKKLHIDR